MFKKVPVWLFLFLILISLNCSILFGSLIVQHYEHGSRFSRLEKVAIYISKIPIEFKQIFLFGDGLGAASKKN